MGFPGGSGGKASAHSAGDLGLIPRLGRSPGEGNGNPLHYSYLENSMDGGAWWATVHGVTKSQTQLSDFSGLSIFLIISKNQLLVSLIHREALKTFLHWAEGLLKWTSQYLNLNVKETMLTDNCSLFMAVSICIIQVYLCWLHIYLWMYNFILD